MPSPPATLRLCFGEAFEDLLCHHQVFAEHRFAFAEGAATLYVIGASSIVLVETEELSLAEIIACGPKHGGLSPFCEAGLSLQAGCEGRAAHQSRRFSYAGEIWTEALSRERTPQPLCGDGQQVSYRFLSEGQPLTEIDALEIGSGRLVVKTVHEYPERGVRVLSHSRWEFGVQR
jgi:hypothetical protein